MPWNSDTADVPIKAQNVIMVNKENNLFKVPFKSFLHLVINKTYNAAHCDGDHNVSYGQ